MAELPVRRACAADPVAESGRSPLQSGDHAPQAPGDHGKPETVMAADKNDAPKSSPRGFYRCALNEAERVGLEEAFDVEGLDDEIALLRVKLRSLLEQQPERTDLHFEAANIIARLVKTRYQIAREGDKTVEEAVQKVLSEIGLPAGLCSATLQSLPRPKSGVATPHARGADTSNADCVGTGPSPTVYATGDIGYTLDRAHG